VIHIGSNN